MHNEDFHVRPSEGRSIGSTAHQPVQEQAHSDNGSAVYWTGPITQRPEEPMELGTPSPDGSPKTGFWLPANGNFQDQHRRPNVVVFDNYVIVNPPATPSPADGHRCMVFPCMDILGSKEADLELRVKMIGIHGKGFKICKIHLSGGDLEKLLHPQWLGDKVIDAFMKLLVADGRSLAIPTMFMNIDDFHPDALLLHLDFSKGRFTFAVVNIQSCHWVLLVAENKAKRISFVDSSPVSEDKMKWISNWRRFVKQKDLKSGDTWEDWQEGAIVSSRQTDNTSCGAFALMNAFALKHNIDLSDLNTQQAVIFRRYVLTRLLHEAGIPISLALICSWPGCKIHSLDQKLCVYCKQWRHVKHWNPSMPTEIPEGFICGDCFFFHQ